MKFATDTVVKTNTMMENLINIAIVSRGNQAVVFVDEEGKEYCSSFGSSYDGSFELGHMVLAHNALQNLNERGVVKSGMVISFQMCGIARHFLNGRRPDKLDKLDNWVNLDDRKKNNWKAVSKALANQIRKAQLSGASVIFTAGTGERTFKRAWAELNKLVPKTQLVNR